MTVLGIDPGVRYTGWAVLRGGQFADSGLFICRKEDKWPQRFADLKRHLAALVEEFEPDVIAIEKAQMSGRGDQGRTEAAVFSMGVATQRTEELAGYCQLLAGQCGAEVVRVHPQTGLRFLGLKRGCTDGECSKAYTLLTGRKLLVKDHHEARALGVALAGEKAHRLAALIRQED